MSSTGRVAAGKLALDEVFRIAASGAGYRPPQRVPVRDNIQGPEPQCESSEDELHSGDH